MPDVPPDIEHNVQVALAQLGAMSDVVPFGLNRASVAWVDAHIDRDRQLGGPIEPDDVRISVIGSFLGQAIAAATGGRWELHQDRWGVRLGEYGICFPLTKVAKHYRQGREEGESILSFYDVVVDSIATGALRTQPGAD